jgi:drug/metabolite transporter (DMT)-like permease
MESRSLPSPAPPTWMVWSALWTVYLVWGSTYLAIRVAVETLPPLLSASARFLVAGALMYVWLLFRGGRERMRVTRAELGACAIVGTALLLGGNGVVAIAEQEVPSALTALIIASVPLWVVLLRSVFGDKVRGGTLLGVVFGFVGVGVLVFPGAQTTNAGSFGVFLVILASISWASGSFFSSRLPLPRDPFVSTAVQMLLGGAVLGTAGVARGELAGIDPSSFSASSMLAVAYLIVAGSLMAFTAYTWLLHNAPISKVSTYAYVNPVVAVFLGWLILSEEITALILIGAAVIVAAVAFIVRQETEDRRRVPEPDAGAVPAPSEAAAPDYDAERGTAPARSVP